MQMGMKREVLAPGVQDGQEADSGAKVFGIGGYFQQRLRHGFEQDCVYRAAVRQGEGVECRRQGEDDVEILHRQQFGGSVLHPARRCAGLALWTVPIAAGVVGNALVLTVIAGLDMPAQGSGAAGCKASQHANLISGRLVQQVSVSSDHVGQLQRRRRPIRNHEVPLGGCP